MTTYFHLQTSNPFPKPQSLSLNVPFRKFHVRCLSAHSCQVPHRIDHFGRKSNVSNPQLLLWLSLVLPMMPVHIVLPHLDLPVLTNCLSCQHAEWHTSDSHRFIFVLQFIHAGLGQVDQRLAWVFNQSCHVGWLWMGGWKRQSLTSHARVISLCKKGKLSHPLWGYSSWQYVWKYHGSPHSCIPQLLSPLICFLRTLLSFQYLKSVHLILFVLFPVLSSTFFLLSLFLLFLISS